MDSTALQEHLLTIARECGEKGPEWAQEPLVLREALRSLPQQDLDIQQQLLTAWHDLFRSGQLSWGYDLVNSGPPFFHLPRR